jgi:hypothetical protein
MAMTYEWSITGLRKRNQVNSEGATLEGAIVQTYWKVVGTDDVSGEVGEFPGATPFTAVDVPAGSFKAFSQLTEDDVLGWVRAYVDNDATYWAHIQERILKQIDERAIEDVADLPWGNATTVAIPEDPIGGQEAEEDVVEEETPDATPDSE